MIMIPELHLSYSLSTSKLVWLIGFIFTSIIVVQYFELPCGNAMSCLFPSSKASLRYIGRNYPSGVALSPVTSPVNISTFENNASSNNFLNHEDGNNKDQTSFATRNNNLGKHRGFENGLGEHGNAGSIQGGKIFSGSEQFGSENRSPPAYLVVPPPGRSPNQDASPRNTVNLSPTSPMLNTSEHVHIHPENTSGLPECNLGRNPSISGILGEKEISKSKKGFAAVLSITTMNNVLLQSHASPLQNSMKHCFSASDQELLEARSQIEKAPLFQSNTDGLYAPIYWNFSRFKRSYELMEQTLKVYIYQEGKKPVFHQPNLKGIYASEGWFMKLMEASKQYVTANPSQAHLFYLPFSSQMLEQAVYVPNSHSFDRLKKYLANYLDMIKTKYSFWNRTSGADHFLVACHDWAPEETRRLMANCIRALCNADIKEGFHLGKDVSLPETLMPPVRYSPKELKGKPSSQRQILAFFAGNMHGYVRPILLKYWENKDPEMKIFGRMHKASYINHMKSSKYCICARGYEVNSPRLVEAIMYGCVPVIISDNFVPPFLEVLNWEKMAVFVLEKDIPNLKNILQSISERRYLILYLRVKMVRQHFLWHTVPEKYDMFHMILHSIWSNRVFQAGALEKK